jgi:hypothetical protein
MKWKFLQLESTHAELGIELMVSESLQNNSEMLHMLLFTLGIDHDVINGDHDKLVQLRHKSGWGVWLPRWKELEVVGW